jgi:two-component system cell cycle response regulator DivK
MLKYNEMSDINDQFTNATILYVEDNADNRTLVRRILMAEGFSLHEAPNAAQALEWLESNIPDLILMDINMPDIDGYTLTSRLKALPGLHNTPIIAITANALRGDRERSLEAGCDGYIQKPIDVDALPRQIMRFLSQRK